MRIKHFSGYGNVNAVKLKHETTIDGMKRVVIKVSGNHERGVYRNDTYDIFNWLVKRFCKDCLEYSKIYTMETYLGYDIVNGNGTDTCTYVIKYRV